MRRHYRKSKANGRCLFTSDHCLQFARGGCGEVGVFSVVKKAKVCKAIRTSAEWVGARGDQEEGRVVVFLGVSVIDRLYMGKYQGTTGVKVIGCRNVTRVQDRNNL